MHDPRFPTGATRGLFLSLALAAAVVVSPPPAAASSSGVSAISAGSFHTCALMTTGGVKCWGYNGSGQLGDGTTTERDTPVDVSGLSSGVAAISAGNYYTCALMTTGGVKCWGYNYFGQLGDGTTTERDTPVDVSGLSSGVAAISTAAGGDHTCALMATGGVKCWGWNAEGQLGDGTNTELHTPVDVSGLTSGVKAISAGSFHTCALMTSGGVKCWGENGSGEIGDGTTTNRLTPVVVSGLSSGIAAISAGYIYTCALTTTGGVKCWGLNEHGELGDGTTTERHTPVDVSGLSSRVAAISAGDWEHTCALMASGGVKCWGQNWHGDLGDGTTTERHTPVDVSGLSSGAAAVSTGGEQHACALMSSGGAKCWGDNSESQLGDGTMTNRLTPVDVSAFTPYDLSILKTGSPDPVAAYAALTYTLTVSDAGPSATTNVVVTDTLPAAVRFGSATPSQGSCSGEATVTCDLGTMNAESSTTVTIVVTPTAPGPLDNTATVSATEPDPSPANNSAVTTTTVKAQQKTRYVSLADAGFSPASLSGVAQAAAVQWNILGPSANGVADGTGMGLFSSGELTPVDYYRFTFTSAGKYAVSDLLGHSMTVKVPEKVSPTSGSTATTFTLMWSSAAAPSGYAFDIRIRRPGGAWARWLTGQTGMSASFVPDAGTGTYKFRARMRNTGNQAVSGWSAVRAITVT